MIVVTYVCLFCVVWWVCLDWLVCCWFECCCLRDFDVLFVVFDCAVFWVTVCCFGFVCVVDLIAFGGFACVGVCLIGFGLWFVFFVICVRLCGWLF